MVVHDYNSSTQEDEAGRSPLVRRQPGLQSELKVTLNYSKTVS